MKVLSAAILTLLIVFSAGAQRKTAKLADLSWLAGCWESSNKATTVNEQWMEPDGGVMLGMGRTVKDGRAVDWEFMRIEERGDGLAFIAKPRASPDETAFPMIRLSATEVVFENPAHDFPQRVIYRLDGEKLSARVEGNMNGRTRGIDFGYVRVKCAGS